MQWHLEIRKISDLKDYHKNPRTLSKQDADHLQKSLEKFGLIDKPIINPDGVIIGGHQRKRILKKIGLKEIECWVPDKPLEVKEIEELNIRLNRNTGEWDWDILANQFEVTDLVDWGFSLDELSLESVENLGSEEESGELLEPKKDEDAKTVGGDIYQLESGSGDNRLCHRVICGDSTHPDVVKRLLEGAVPVLMVTDPPYGVDYDPSWRNIRPNKGKNNQGKVQNDDKVNWALAWHLFPGSVVYVWHDSLFHSEVEKSLIENDYKLISQIIWVKQHFALSRGDYHWQHETCLYAVKKGHFHNWQGARDQSTIWEIKSGVLGGTKDEEKTGHGTQKPIECMARPIRNNSKKGESVYDPFIGSGTMLIAAEQLGRNCFGIEISPAYVDIVIDRWVKYMKKNWKEYIIKKNGEEIQWSQEDQNQS